MNTSPRSAASSAGITAKPSIRASSARSGSTSHTITEAPSPCARSATPHPVHTYPRTTTVSPASSRFVARRIPSSTDCPVPKRSLNARSARASLTAITGTASPPAASSARSRTSPVVVSSVPPSMPASRSGRAVCSAPSRSAPSSSVIRGRRATTAATPSAQSSGPPAKTEASSASAAATSGWGANGLDAHSATSAPPACSARTRFAVSEVTCRHAPTTTPASGRSRAKRSRIERSTGICPSAHSIRARPRSISALVAIVLRLVRALDRNVDVRRLLGRELGQPRAQRVEVQPRHLLVEVLGQDVDALVVLRLLGEQLDLRDRLVREGVRHHERRVAGRVAEVQQPAFGEHDDRVPVGEAPLVDLRLDLGALDPLELAEAGHVDLVVEVADVAHDRLVLHARHVLGGDHVPVAGGGDEDVPRLDDVVQARHLVALHRRLQRADRVDLGDDDPRALAAERLRAALADVAVAEDDGDLAADHHVGRTVDAVDQRAPPALDVV